MKKTKIEIAIDGYIDSKTDCINDAIFQNIISGKSIKEVVLSKDFSDEFLKKDNKSLKDLKMFIKEQQEEPIEKK